MKNYFSIMLFLLQYILICRLYLNESGEKSLNLLKFLLIKEPLKCTKYFYQVQKLLLKYAKKQRLDRTKIIS